MAPYPAPYPLPRKLTLACRRLGLKLTPDLLLVWVGSQRVDWLSRIDGAPGSPYRCRRRLVASSSRFGVGQLQNSHRTPLGVHRVARKVGGGWPIGTVFVARRPVGWTWHGTPQAAIAHRIFWLEGLESGANRGGLLDSFRRCIYVHGIGDELTLGRPASRGCIHLAANDLMRLFEAIPTRTLVWICQDDGPGVGFGGRGGYSGAAARV